MQIDRGLWQRDCRLISSPSQSSVIKGVHLVHAATEQLVVASLNNSVAAAAAQRHYVRLS